MTVRWAKEDSGFGMLTEKERKKKGSTEDER